MTSLENLLKESMEANSLISFVISNNKSKDLDYKKVDIEPVLIRGKIYYQFTFVYQTRVDHENLLADQAINRILNIIGLGFRQAAMFTLEKDYQILISKKGKLSIIDKNPSKTMDSLDHNRMKKYIIEEDKPCDFLIRLDVMNKDGKVYKNMYDKFKQINRFLELVEDIINNLNKSGPIKIIDFGCGKSYLTFALYHYLVKIKGLDVNIVGLDLKKDVIDHCNKVAHDLNYDKLEFIHGDIKDFQNSDPIDMIVTLHACDTATDAALVKAIDWNADLILSVPCCQKEIRRSLDNPVLSPMLRHGFIKEKLASLVTDSLRALVLENLGYEVQLVEFIDIENTPKIPL